MQEFVGKIVDIKYSNESSFFHVAQATSDDGKPVRLAGTFLGIKLARGMKVRCRGAYEVHPTYGQQFTVSAAEVQAERSKIGVISYLTSNVKSIGPITAAKLYDHFGEKLLDILNSNIELIRSASCLTENQANTLIREWGESNGSRNSTIFLSDIGLSTYQIKTVLTHFGAEARKKIEENPYFMVQLPGIGFATAEKVGRHYNILENDPRRIRAIVFSSISDLCQNEGHVYVDSDQIKSYINTKFARRNSLDRNSFDGVSDSLFYSTIMGLISEGSIIQEESRIYLPTLHTSEYNIAKYLKLTMDEPPFQFDNLEGSLQEYQEQHKIKLSDNQLKAYLQLGTSRALAISGFPGTGKTTMISAFVHLFEKQRMSYSLLSPTGIAAKRLSQVTGKPASTIHRALGYKNDGSWEFHAGNKYHVDAVIVDEMSMVDSLLMEHLLESLPNNTIKIFVGDSAQLPSVGPGYVLNHLIRSTKMPSVALTRIYRQGKTSDIISTAHNILNGEPVDISFRPESEFVVLPFTVDDTVNEIKDLCTRLKMSNRNFQVIAPMYDGELGVNRLNNELRSCLNPDAIPKKSVHIKSGETDLYEGDRVMIIKNDYERGVYNGDTGKVIKIDIRSDSVEVKVFNWFDPTSSVNRYSDKILTFKVEEARSMLKVAYACTAHKVQGQEFDYVVMPMSMGYGIMLYKNLVYTSITRAKKKVFIMGDPNSFLLATSNTRDITRNSYLSNLLDA